MRNIVFRYLRLAFFQCLERLVVLAFIHQAADKHGEPAAVGEAHALGGLINVESWLTQVAITIFVHHVVVHLLRIHHSALSLILLEGERSETPCDSFLHEMLIEVTIIVRSHRCGHIQRT